MTLTGSPSWSFEVIDRQGVVVAALVPQRARLTSRINSWATLELELDAESLGAAEVDVGRRIRAWREPAPTEAVPDPPAVLRFNGDVGDPVTDQGDPDAGETATAVAHDPFEALAARFLEAPLRFDLVDAGAIAEALLDGENATDHTGLRIGTVDASVNRDRGYELGKEVGEAITQLAEVEQGFWFAVLPVDEDDVVGALEIRYPDAGSDRPGVRFEYGEGTTGSLETFTAERLRPVNRVLAIGATPDNEDGGEAEPLTAIADDPTSRGVYGRRMRRVSFVDVSEQATLDAHAAAELRPDPQAVYSFTVVDPEGADANPPRPFDDFAVGDTVRVSARGDSPRLVADDVPVQVNSFTVEIDAEGTERIAEIVLEAVEEVS